MCKNFLFDIILVISYYIILFLYLIQSKFVLPFSIPKAFYMYIQHLHIHISYSILNYQLTIASVAAAPVFSSIVSISPMIFLLFPEFSLFKDSVVLYITQKYLRRALAQKKYSYIKRKKEEK